MLSRQNIGTPPKSHLEGQAARGGSPVAPAGNTVAFSSRDKRGSAVTAGSGTFANVEQCVLSAPCGKNLSLRSATAIRCRLQGSSVMATSCNFAPMKSLLPRCIAVSAA